MDTDQLRAFAETARRFARREVEPAVGTEGRDGDLAAVRVLTDRAESAGLVSSGAADSSGHEFGVWGRASVTDGPLPSITVLQEIATACAGTALNIHLAGLSALEQLDDDRTAKNGLKRAGVALFNPSFRPTWETLRSPPDAAVRLERKGGATVLNGTAGFVHEPPGSEGFVVYAKGEQDGGGGSHGGGESGGGGWERLLVPRGAKGLRIEDTGQRLGLSACPVSHLTFAAVPVTEDAYLSPRDPCAFLKRLFYGLCGIAVGNARGALHAATLYSHERYQGGALIKSHPAVRLLLGDSASRIEAGGSHLAQVAGAEVTDDELASTWRAAAARLRITEDCFQAVTDCLQVFGGYGYMEEFRLEKRLRDAMTLKTMVVRPDDLRLLCSTEPSGGES